MDKKYFIDLLEQREVDLEKSKNRWNLRAEEFYEYSKNNEHNSTMEFLEEFIDVKDKLVLDVGFGAGKYLKLLSDKGSKLSGVELSDEMFRYAKKHCEENGINFEEMELYNSAWEDIDLDKLNWRNKFDLVFASMSPASGSYESIQKLIGASKKGVFCSTHVLMEEDILSEAYREINGEDYEFMKHRFWSIYNILYLEGYYPSVKIEHKKRETEFTTDELVERYSPRIFSDSPSEEDLSKLKKIIQNHEVDGKINVNREMKNALIYFEV